MTVGSSVSLKYLEWLAPNFDWLTPVKDVQINFPTSLAAAPVQFMRESLMRFPSSGSPAVVTAAKYDLDGLLINSFAIPAGFAAAPYSADGRQAFLRHLASTTPSKATGARMRAQEDASGFTIIPQPPSSYVNSTVALRIWPDETVSDSPPVWLRIDESGAISEVHMPDIARLFPEIPSGAESFELWSENREFSLMSAILAGRDAVYFVATSTVNRVYKGSDAGTTIFEDGSYSPPRVTTEPMIMAAYALRYVIGLFRMTADGTISLVNVLFQRTAKFLPGPSVLFNNTGTGITYKTLYIQRSRLAAGPSGTYLQPRYFKTVEVSDSDHLETVNTVNMSALVKFGKYMFVKNGTIGFIRVEVGVHGTFLTPNPGGRAILSMVALENHGVLYGKTNAASVRSDDGGMTWSTTGATPYPPIETPGNPWLGM
ncbi:hypothetical protein GHL01_00340 [Sinorhizobium meliloti]|uniref:hypothetical protein n=1 Tax=Rhizobium meliloti TaxID=382 RepID=UPI00129789A9|nr:hypothetical protein [Sinorhizobium meliloti]MQV12193.1 hypothetical protein [Sinorhizobium meliloti]